MEDIRELKEQVKSLEKRVEALEAVLNGKMAQKPGRKPKLSVAQRDEIIRKQTDEIDRLRARLASLSGSNQAPS